MPAIISVHIWRPAPGQQQTFLAGAAAAKKIHERLGGKVRLRATQFGGSPMSYVYAVEYDSWAAFGAFGAAVEADAEWQAFWQAAQANPTSELVSSAVMVEVAV